MREGARRGDAGGPPARRGASPRCPMTSGGLNSYAPTRRQHPGERGRVELADVDRAHRRPRRRRRRSPAARRRRRRRRRCARGRGARARLAPGIPATKARTLAASSPWSRASTIRPGMGRGGAGEQGELAPAGPAPRRPEVEDHRPARARRRATTRWPSSAAEGEARRRGPDPHRALGPAVLLAGLAEEEVDAVEQVAERPRGRVRVRRGVRRRASPRSGPRGRGRGGGRRGGRSGRPPGRRRPRPASRG